MVASVQDSGYACQRHADTGFKSACPFGGDLNQRVGGGRPCASGNTAIATSQTFEANEKTVNGIYFSTLAIGNSDFSPTQLTQLQGLAGQCPYAGGTAVFKARAMLSGDYFTNYDDRLLCQVSDGHLKSPSDSNQQSAGFVAYPNPANHELNISFESRERSGKLTVFDAFGRRVGEHLLQENRVNLILHTDDWGNGVYFLRLMFENEAPITQSVIISH